MWGELEVLLSQSLEKILPMMCLISTGVWLKTIFVGTKMKKKLWKTKLTMLLETTCQGNF